VLHIPKNGTDKKWAAEFEKIKSELASFLGDLAISIEHVGSTSVPGLWAKPIIDIDIVIENDLFEAVKEKLAAIGYFHVGDLGIAEREAFDYKSKNHLMEHHLYVCEKDSGELRRHLTFRNHLRTYQEHRDSYSEVKREMAGKTHKILMAISRARTS
jgi:GrpB-like predicted nucleotidyltransferase (UPF0157 family)